MQTAALMLLAVALMKTGSVAEGGARDPIMWSHPRLPPALGAARCCCKPAAWRAPSLRGGSAMLDRDQAAWDVWEMVTGADDLNDNVTMLQQRDSPHLVVELWWESEGKLRFTYDELGEDIMCVWPHGGTSNHSAWELEDLRSLLIQRRGLCEQLVVHPQEKIRLGAWTAEAQILKCPFYGDLKQYRNYGLTCENSHQANGSSLLIRNQFQPGSA